MSYDPFKDENKKFTLDQWSKEAKTAIDDFVERTKETIEGGKNPKTWRDWMNSFISYMSW